MAKAKSTRPVSGNGGALPQMGATRAQGSRQRIGEVLVSSNVISLDQLDKALAEQKESTRMLGQSVVQLGFASETEVLGVINRHYGVSLTALVERLPVRDGTLHRAMDQLTHMRVPIRAKLSISVIFSLLVTILILSFVILERQRENLYQQTVKTGKVSLAYFANSAKTPLLNNEVLRLNQLIKEATTTEGIVYAYIEDRDGVVQAHTDATKLRKKIAPPSNPRAATQEGVYKYFQFTNGSGAQVLNISAPVAYGDKVLGEVNVGVSLDFISAQIRKETLAVVLLSVLIIALGVVFSIFLSIGFSRPISKLVVATKEIGQGNLKYRLDLRRNDELGDLASSFNFMSSELWRKKLMQESFGKYVGSDIVQMILANPESSWLKGTRQIATVMFTDVRGFTAYSEHRDPEAIVEALNQYFEIATRVIIAHGGMVDKFIGDSVMGLFGVPIATETHAEQCVRACMEMQKEFMAASKRSGNEILAKVGIGVNTGPLVSGNLGSEAKMEYSVIGDDVNKASRINHLAKAGDVVISKSTYDPIRSLITAEELEPQQVKGKSEPLQVFRVLSIKEPLPHAQAQKAAQHAAT